MEEIENAAVIIMVLPFPNFIQTGMEKDRRLPRFKSPPARYELISFDAFSE